MSETIPQHSENPETPAPERWRREQFIPIAERELAAALERETEFLPGERRQFREFCARLATTFELESQQRLQALSRAYGPLDPDADVVELEAPTDAERQRLVERFFADMRQLLQRANYQALSQNDLQNALTHAGDCEMRLEVDFQAFDRLEVYSRGDVTQHRSRRRWLWLYRPRDFSLPVFQRLVVMFRPRAKQRFAELLVPQHVYLKLFKNIPRHDLELLLPGSRVRMSLVDQGRIWLPTLSGVGLALWKIVQGAVVLAFESLFGVAALLAFIGGTLGYGLRSYYGYQQTKEKHQLTLTTRLYYQNLDNNAGVLYRLLEEARAQEYREALLAYFLLWRSPLAAGHVRRELDEEGEALLRRLLDLDIDLEIDDALAKLARLKLAEELPGDRWRVTPLAEALRLLERHGHDLLNPGETVGVQLKVRRAA